MRLRHKVACLVALVVAGTDVSAQGITLFGDARLGLGYNIRNNGTLDTERFDPDGAPIPIAEQQGREELRAISRVRFGVIMAGATDGGIGFGAIMRADHGPRAGANPEGQICCLVYVTGDAGTLSYGDVDGADQHRVGSPAPVGLTDLGELEQPPYFTNGGGRAGDETGIFLDIDALPTVRYDYDAAGFGVSVSTNRSLDVASVGGSYTFSFEAGEVALGVGYADLPAFVSNAGVSFPPIDQFTAGVTGAYGDVFGALVYANADGGGDAEDRFETLAGGLGYDFGPWQANGFFQSVLKAVGPDTFELIDGETAWGLGAALDLGGGAVLRGGYVRDYGANNRADLGIALSF